MTRSDFARRVALALALVALIGLGACSGSAKETTLLIRVTTSTLVVPDDVDELIIHVDGVESMTMLDERFPLPSFPQT